MGSRPASVPVFAIPPKRRLLRPDEGLRLLTWCCRSFGQFGGGKDNDIVFGDDGGDLAYGTGSFRQIAGAPTVTK